jgi:hypothetical protein
MKRRRKSWGAPPKNAARAHYDQLIKQGKGTSEACRIVGISRSSGTRWRHGHTVVLKSGDIKKYAPISHRRPTVVSARFLSEPERITVADPLHTGRSICDIVKELGRSPSTVSRRSRQRSGKIVGNPELREFVKEHLEQRWSPRQISNRLPLTSPDNRRCTSCLRPNVMPCTGMEAWRGSLDLAVDPAPHSQADGPVAVLAAERSTRRSGSPTWS